MYCRLWDRARRVAPFLPLLKIGFGYVPGIRYACSSSQEPPKVYVRARVNGLAKTRDRYRSTHPCKRGAPSFSGVSRSRRCYLYFRPKLNISKNKNEKGQSDRCPRSHIAYTRIGMHRKFNVGQNGAMAG